MAEEAAVMDADGILDHLVSLAEIPAWKKYAWHAAKHYEELDPYRCKGMQERLKQRMTERKQQQ
jgi:hypothetical protein